MSKKNRGAIIVSLCVTIAILVALVSATYTWFSRVGEVESKGREIQAESGAEIILGSQRVDDSHYNGASGLGVEGSLDAPYVVLIDGYLNCVSMPNENTYYALRIDVTEFVITRGEYEDTESYLYSTSEGKDFFTWRISLGGSWYVPDEQGYAKNAAYDGVGNNYMFLQKGFNYFTLQLIFLDRESYLTWSAANDDYREAAPSEPYDEWFDVWLAQQEAYGGNAGFAFCSPIYMYSTFFLKIDYVAAAIQQTVEES